MIKCVNMTTAVFRVAEAGEGGSLWSLSDSACFFSTDDMMVVFKVNFLSSRSTG